MIRNFYLLKRIQDAGDHSEDITMVERDINTIPWSDRMVLDSDVPENKLRSPEVPSAMMATFELEIGTDNLWMKLAKISAVVIMLFIIEVFLPTQWSKIVVRIASTVIAIFLS